MAFGINNRCMFGEQWGMCPAIILVPYSLFQAHATFFWKYRTRGWNLPVPYLKNSACGLIHCSGPCLASPVMLTARRMIDSVKYYLAIPCLLSVRRTFLWKLRVILNQKLWNFTGSNAYRVLLATISKPTLHVDRLVQDCSLSRVR